MKFLKKDVEKRKKQQVGLEPATIIGRGWGLATRILLQLQAINHQALIYLRNVMFFIRINTAINRARKYSINIFHYVYFSNVCRKV